MQYKLLLLSLLFSGVTADAQISTWTADNGNGTYTNPLFYDEFSDPDCIRVGEDYYLAGTTMHCAPGLVVLHSKDLVNWELASYCFNRWSDILPDDKFKLINDNQVYGQGVWAPVIRYHEGKFYVFTNVNGNGLQLFISDSAYGPWEHRALGGHIYDLSVLFDEGHVYAIHGYDEVKVTEFKPDFSGYVEGSERIIIPKGSGMGEGHHAYKIDGKYYILSSEYAPMGRMQCARSESIYGPYETTAISVMESLGTQKFPLVTNANDPKNQWMEDGYKFTVVSGGDNELGNATIHQGGMLMTPNGDWYGLTMLDFVGVGRTTCLCPITWTDGWPMWGLEGNPGRTPRTWVIPDGKPSAPKAPYVRSDNFDGKQLGRIWQWNHNPEDKMWQLKGGKLRLNSMPADQLMWARNSLTQRVIGPSSTATVELYTKGMKDGDVAGLGNINVPCSWVGIVKDGKQLILRWFEQAKNDTIDQPMELPKQKIWLRMCGDYDDDQAEYYYSIDGEHFYKIGCTMKLSYQLITFQGSRHALFAFNKNGVNGGYAEFDNFTVEEPDADRSQNIPYGKTFRIINLANGRPMVAMPHGLMYDTNSKDNSKLTHFRLIDKGQGKVSLQCEDGRYVWVSGLGLAGDVRLTTDASKAEEFLWQDYLNGEFMLMSLRTHLYIGKSPTTGSPYSMDYKGADPARRNGAVFRWEEVVK